MNNQKGFAPLVAIAIVAAVVLGGYFGFVYKKCEGPIQLKLTGEDYNPRYINRGDRIYYCYTYFEALKNLTEEILLNNTSSSNEIFETNQTTSLEETNWKTYTDAQYGFEFKYPPGHELDEFDLPIRVSGGTVYGGEHSITFGIKDKTFWGMDYNDKLSFAVKFRPNGEIFTPEEYLKNAFPTRSNDAESMHSYTKGIANGRLQKTTFAGHRAIVESPSYLSAGYKTIYLYGSEDNYFILISQGTDAKVLSQILSTFKFTK